jgi:hypothetical protein
MRALDQIFISIAPPLDLSHKANGSDQMVGVIARIRCARRCGYLCTAGELCRSPKAINLRGAWLSQWEVVNSSHPVERTAPETLEFLLHIVVNFRHGLRMNYIAVAVELRKPPRIARIVDAVESRLTGGVT